VAKWRKRTSISDRRTGPQEPRSTVLSVEDEAVLVAFRCHTLLPLDDCLYALQAHQPRRLRPAQPVQRVRHRQHARRCSPVPLAAR
jgi:hypothetical protein